MDVGVDVAVGSGVGVDVGVDVAVGSGVGVDVGTGASLYTKFCIVTSGTAAVSVVDALGEVTITVPVGVVTASVYV